MKRYIAIILAVCLVLIVSLVLCMFLYKRAQDAVVIEENFLPIRYLYGGFKRLEGDNPQAFVIESCKQLSDFDLESWGGYSSGFPKEVWIRHSKYAHPDIDSSGVEKPLMNHMWYSDSFFQTHYLIVVRCTLDSSSYLLESEELDFTPSGQVNVFLNVILDKNYIGQDGSLVKPGTQGQWCIVYEVDRNEGVVTAEQVSVVIDKSINTREDIIDPRLPASA